MVLRRGAPGAIDTYWGSLKAQRSYPSPGIPANVGEPAAGRERHAGAMGRLGRGLLDRSASERIPVSRCARHSKLRPNAAPILLRHPPARAKAHYRPDIFGGTRQEQRYPRRHHATQCRDPPRDSRGRRNSGSPRSVAMGNRGRRTRRHRKDGWYLQRCDKRGASPHRRPIPHHPSHHSRTSPHQGRNVGYGL